MESLKAGVAVCEINPEKGVILGGYPHVLRKNTGIHDSLYASVLYLDNGNPVVLASLDLVGFSKVYSDRLRDGITERTGISRSNIYIMCTHTHSSPYCMALLNANETEGVIDEQYIETVCSKVTDAILKAMGNSFPASVGIGKGKCGRDRGVGGNRNSPDGISDPEVGVLGVKDKNGVLRACVANYALHPTFLHAENLLVSGDYPGYIREYLHKASPEVVFLFAQGASGDQSSRYFRNGQSFEEAKRVGYALGEEIQKVLENIKYEENVLIKIKSTTIDTYLKDIPSVEEAVQNLKRVRDEYDNSKRNHAGYAVLRSIECNIFGAERTLEYAQLKKENRKLPRIDEEHPMEVGLLEINNSCMVLLQGEIFVRFGLDVKSGSTCENTFVIEMVNGGSAGYIYTKEALEEYDGYEIQSSQYSWEMGENMVKAVIKLMKD